FPRLDELKPLPPTYIASLKESLIADKQHRWDSLDHKEKERIWKQLFDHEQYEYPYIHSRYPKLNWKGLKGDYLNRAEMVLWSKPSDREKIFSLTRIAKIALHQWLADYKADADTVDVVRFENLTGLYFLRTPQKDAKVSGLGGDQKYRFEVHSFRG